MKKKAIEIQYAKNTTLRIELLSIFQASYDKRNKHLANFKCELVVNGIPIAQATRALGVGDKLDFSYDQAVLSFLSYGGLEPLVENIEKLKAQLLPAGQEESDGRGIEGVSIRTERSGGECEGDPEGDLRGACPFAW